MNRAFISINENGAFSLWKKGTEGTKISLGSAGYPSAKSSFGPSLQMKGQKNSWYFHGKNAKE
jgi:hypothetical protein